MQVDAATQDDNRPPAPSEECRARWEHQGLRHRLGVGMWRPDADRRLRDFFTAEAYEFLPDAVIAFNPQKSFTSQTSTLYDGTVTIHGQGKDLPADDLEALGTDMLWPQMQETLEYVRAMNDCFLLRSWDARRGRVRYLTVPVDAVDAEADPEDPSQPIRVVHYRRRRVPGRDGLLWCRDTYDFSQRIPAVDGHPIRIVPWLTIDCWCRSADPSQPDPHWEDVTYDVMPELRADAVRVDEDGNPAPPIPRLGRWPYWESSDPDAAPIWCWTAYHARVGSRLFDPWTGSELVDLTLIVAVLWTYWMGGFRDAAHLQRWMLDCDLASKPAPSAGSGKSISWVASNPMMVMRLKSESDVRPGNTGSWESPFDVAKAAEAICNLMASGALFAGLSPADVSVGNAGLSRTSGYAIEVSRDGKRKVEKRLVKPMSLADAHNLAHAARLANAYAGTILPTEPEEYQIVYSETPRTVAEVQAEVDEIVKLQEAGLLHPADGLRRLEPHLTDDQAREKVLEIAQFNADLAAVTATNTAGNTAETDAALAAVDGVIATLPPETTPAMRAMLGQIRDAFAGGNTGGNMPPDNQPTT